MMAHEQITTIHLYNENQDTGQHQLEAFLNSWGHHQMLEKEVMGREELWYV